MTDTDFRPLSAGEQKTLERLFTLDFIGRDKLREQLSTATVRPTDSNGSLQFRIGASHAIASVKDGTVVEATYLEPDADLRNPVRVNVLLHVRSGKLNILEVFKDDSSQLSKPLDPDKFDLFTQQPNKT